MSTSYSSTPLAKKLGIKENFKTIIINSPANYKDLIGEFYYTFGIQEISICKLNELSSQYDLIHFFCFKFSELEENIEHLKNKIAKNGIIWVSWIKKASKLHADIDEDKIRNIALKIGLVDIKVAAIDENWSGLKLVIPINDR